MNITSNKKWNRAGLLVAGAAIGISGLFLSGRAIGIENDKAAPPPLNPAITAPVRSLSQAFEAVAAQVRPAVVSVYSERMVKDNEGEFNLPFGNGNGNPNDLFRQFFGRNEQGEHGQEPAHHQHKVPEHGMGSGMILDKEGHILTNYHVVKDVDTLKVKLADNRQFDAKVVGTDPKSDVAIIQIKDKVPDNLPTVKLGDSKDLKVGDWVMAIGAPFGLTQTVTAGIISATGRNDVGIEDYEDFLQTDAAINPGNSGGPLVNMDGQVIGMNTAIATGMGQFAGVGFAIPSDMIKGFVPTLAKGGTITRGFLGVGIQDLSDSLAAQFKTNGTNGALVSQVNNDTPAAKAGLKSGDVIVRYDGKAIDNTRTLRQLVADTTPATKIPLTVMRDGKEVKLDVTVGKMPTKEVAANSSNENAEPGSAHHFGMNVQPLTPDLAQQLGTKADHGVVIDGVEPGSPAATAELQPGDIIVEANRKPVDNVKELKSALASNKDSALLLIKRHEASLYVSLKVS
ncbi:MAG TPA: DegQ family serine endoprotease [Chthoniobacter sp.]|jgi:serine protease Do